MINNLRYADDTVILAETEHELQHLMDIVIQESELKGLFLNMDKSYTMVFTKSSSIHTCQIEVHCKPLEQVNSFVFLRSVFTSDVRCEKEVKRPIRIAKTAFTSIVWEKHQYAGSSENTEMLYLVNSANTYVKHGHWAKDDEKHGNSRTLFYKENVENTLD